MGWFGNVIGSALGKMGAKVLPIPGVDGEKLGGFLGGLAPFEKGGRIARRVRGMRKGGKVKKAGRKRGCKCKK